MPSCVLRYCKSRYGITPDRDYSLFSFPQDINTRRKWIQFVRLERREDNWLPSAASKLCSKHFRKEDIYFGRTGRPILKRVSFPNDFIASTVNKREQNQTLYQTSSLDYQEEDDSILNASSSNYLTPSRILKMCRVCLATNCKFYALTRFKNLDKAYKLLTGISPKNEIELPPFLCNVCAHRLLNSVHFRAQSLRAHSVLIEAVHKHDEMKLPVTLESIKSIIGEQRLGTNLGTTHNPTDYYNLDIQHVPRENQNVQIEPVQVKIEKVDVVESDDNAAATSMCSIGMHKAPAFVKVEEERTEDLENINDTRNNVPHVKIENDDRSDFHDVPVIYETKNQDVTDVEVIKNKAASAKLYRKPSDKDYKSRTTNMIDQDRRTDGMSTDDGKFCSFVPGWREQISVNHADGTPNDDMICGTSSLTVKR